MDQLNLLRLPIFQALPKSQKRKGWDDIQDFLGFKVIVEREAYLRKISLSVKPNGQLKIRCGKSLSPDHVFQFLEESKEWLIELKAEHEKILEKYPPKKYVKDEEYLFQGKLYRLDFKQTANKKYSAFVKDDQIIVLVPRKFWTTGYREISHPELKDVISDFYKAAGVRQLKKRVDVHARWMGLYPEKLMFRSQKTRWGSCSSRGHISLNWRLIGAPEACLDYVVVHELAHLKHHDHSPAFWELVSRYSPHYEICKKWLREHQFHFEFLAKNSDLY